MYNNHCSIGFAWLSFAHGPWSGFFYVTIPDMKKEIAIDEQKIIYTLRRNPRTKKLRLCVYPDGSLTASAPKRLSIGEVESFILEKSRWIMEKLAVMKRRENNPLFHKSSKEEYKKYKKQAKELAAWKLRMFNEAYGFQYKKISIRNQKTRWGSCSEKGTLSYNYKITLLPEKYADYIIVHELCHLGEFNHSRRFWDLVSKTIPDFRAMRKELRKS